MQQNMTEGKVLPLILKFSLPLFIGNLFQQLYNMVDTVIVGRYVGAGALAAVGSTGTIMFLLIGFSFGLTSGFAILTSQRFGAKDSDGVRSSVANGIILTAIISLVLTVLGTISIPHLLKWMNTPADIMEDARSYISIISMGLAANLFYNILSAFLRAVGNSKAPLFFLVFSAVLNVFLDILFIVTFHMGVAGAAFATVLSQAISAIFCIIYIMKSVSMLMPKRNEWRLTPQNTAHQLKLGIPMALQFGITASGTMIMQAAINIFGSVAVAAFTAASKVQILLTQGMMAVGQTMATYAGQNYGKMDIGRIKEGVKIADIILIAYSILAAALLALLLPQMMELFFSKDADVSAMMPWAKTYSYISMAFFIPLSFIFVYRNTIEGCSYAMLALLMGVIEFVSRCLTAVIAIHLNSYVLAVSCDPAAWLFGGVFGLFAFKWVIKDLNKKLAQQ